MLRDSCGNYLADQGTDLRTMQDYLGHRDPKHTAHYTRVAGHRSKAYGGNRETDPLPSRCGQSFAKPSKIRKRNSIYCASSPVLQQ